MAEKKGSTGKLTFDFNVSRCLEVEYSPEKWARVTPETFRSFHGNRRILNIDYSPSIYEPYEGPVYQYLGSQIVENPIEGINYKEGEGVEFYTKKRGR